MTHEILDILLKVTLTILLSSLIGTEREYRHKEAGLKTHILVGVGSCLIVLTSFHVFDIYKNTTMVDPTRMMSGIIAGIGFLCGGTIIRAGNQVSGLTTAAALWTVSGIGMAIGAGHYSAGIVFTIVIFAVLVGLRRLESRIKK